MTEKSFEIISDEGIFRARTFGKTLNECFLNALKVFGWYLKPDIVSLVKKAKKVKNEIKVEAIDLNSLAVEFLSEVLSRSTADNLVPTGITFKRFGENFLEGDLIGISVDTFEKELKSVSYDKVDIKKNPETGLYEFILAFEI